MPIDPKFVERYRLFEPKPVPETLEKRWSVVETFGKKDQASSVTFGLVCLVSGRSAPNFEKTFREAFFASDPTFQTSDNQTEVAVLAAAALDQLLKTRSVPSDLAGTAIIAALSGSGRTEQRWYDLKQTALSYVREEANRIRQSNTATWPTIAFPNATKKLDARLKALRESSEAVNELELAEATDHLQKEALTRLQEITAANKTLSETVAMLSEELNILSWCFAGYSRELERPLHDLDPALAALVVARELSDLTEFDPSVVAPAGIIGRVLKAADLDINAQISLSDVIAKIPSELDLSQLTGSSEVSKSLCSNLYAIQARAQFGDHWQANYKTTTACDPKKKTRLLTIATEMYYEWMLIRQS